MGPIQRHEHTVRIANLEGLRGRWRVRDFPDLPLDEPPEFYGSDTAPSPADYLLIAVGGCLVNSLAFCFQRRRVRALLEAEAVGTISRDAEGQLRVAEIGCTLAASAPWTITPRFGRATICPRSTASSPPASGAVSPSAPTSGSLLPDPPLRPSHRYPFDL